MTQPSIFEFRDGLWQSREEASGPYGGIHGGAVSGLLIGELEQKAEKAGWGTAMSAKSHLVRAASRLDLTTQTDIVKEGRRLSVIENTLNSGGKVQTKAIVTFMNDMQVGIYDQAPVDDNEDRIKEIEQLPEWFFMAKINRKNGKRKDFLNAVDVRQEGEDTIWARLKIPLFKGAATPLATAAAIADFSSLFSATFGGSQPDLAGWPNANLDVHLSRAPVGEWIGVKPKSYWYPHGTGLTESELYDSVGLFGRSCQTVVLIPNT